MAAVLDIGPYFFSKTKITFKELWGFVIIAEFVFLLVPILNHLVLFLPNQLHSRRHTIFYPLSALSIIKN
jgi:hypothetical protein